MIDIKGLREALKMSQKEMCEALDMPQPLLSAIENRKKPLPKAAYEKIYNLYGDMILKYKLPDIVIEVKKEEPKDVICGPIHEYKAPPLGALLEMLKDKDAKLEEKEKEIRQLIKENATLKVQLDIAKKGGYRLKEAERDVGGVAADL